MLVFVRVNQTGDILEEGTGLASFTHRIDRVIDHRLGRACELVD